MAALEREPVFPKMAEKLFGRVRSDPTEIHAKAWVSVSGIPEGDDQSDDGGEDDEEESLEELRVVLFKPTDDLSQDIKLVDDRSGGGHRAVVAEVKSGGVCFNFGIQVGDELVTAAEMTCIEIGSADALLEV
jgi:hypothetical protein